MMADRLTVFESISRYTGLRRLYLIGGCLLYVVGLSLVVPIRGQGRADPQQQRFFESKIRPVLIEHCYECHSSDADEPGGNLLLDSREGLRRGGSSGPAVVPGRSRSSLLLAAIKHEDPNLSMPPADYGEKLPDQTIEDFERWIASGAWDPRQETAARPTYANPESENWWAWKRIARPAVPDVQDGDWPQNDLDRFILHSLETQGISPSAEADRLSLVRRLSFDLTGLPPTSNDLQEYALADEPQSIENLVDKYLASEQFGERFARHWLDVARYAESSGKDINSAYPHAWRYRDYVIDSFHRDKPIDQFITEQIAGDLLPRSRRTSQEDAERLIATGFLAVGPKSINEMNPRQFALDLADEQIDAVSQAFLGVTLACARCHDHKFDPIAQRDYTAMAGIFLSTATHFGTLGGVAGRNRSSLVELPKDYLSDSESAAGKIDEPELTRLRKRVDELQQERNTLLRERIAGGTPDDSTRAKALRIAQQLSRLQAELDAVDEEGNLLAQAMGVSDKAVAPRIPNRVQPQRSVQPNRIRPPRARPLPPPTAEPTGQGQFGNRVRQAREIVYITDSPLLIRGELDKPGEIVPRGLPEFLSSGFSARIPENQSGRLQLAAWITSPQNPLTARVYANRVWSWLLGDGIVATEDNFGTSGELPSHAELLDYLASELVSNGWSTKFLVRQIVLSNTYQQSSAVNSDGFQADPDNRLYWRANRRAMDAESLRDGMLAISGRLNSQRPSGSLVADAGDGVIGGRRGGGLSEEAITTADPAVRSIYLPVPRNVLPDSLELFDFADNSVVAGSRELTIVPAQALYWMNSSAVDEICRAIAEELLGALSVVEIEELHAELCLRILSRLPLDEEVAAVREYVQTAQREKRDMTDCWTGVTRALFSSADYRFLN